MDDGNNSNNQQPSGSGGNHQQQHHGTLQSSSSGGPYNRVRRPSASIISSTTPMFQAPQNPNLQLQQPPPPSSLHSRQRRQQQHNVIQNHNFGSGDIDDDVQPQASSSSSSSSSLRGRLSAGVNNSASASSNINSNNRPQSPMGSLPDSTAYWGPSPSPSAASVNSYRSPLTPGGMCVVSSSTSDDIPQSPLSPEDLGGNSNHGFPQPPPPPSAAIVGRNSAAPLPNIMDVNDFNFNQNMGGQLPRRRPSLVASSSSHNLSLSSSSNPRGGSNNIGLGNNQFHQNQNQDLNQNPRVGSNSQAQQQQQQQQSFNISPLRNKIKKASSFERFSLAQAAITLNSSSGNNNASTASHQSQNVGVVGNSSGGSNNNISSDTSFSSSSISSLPPTTTSSSSTTNNSSIGTNYTSSNSSSNNSVNQVAGPSSRTSIWDPSPPPPPHTTATTTTTVTEIITPSSSASGLRAFSSLGLSDKFHIKIPSKKLAAKIASVYEQEKLNEQLNNANNNNNPSLAEAASIVGSSGLVKRSGLSSVIASVAGSSSLSQNDNSGGLIITNSNSSSQVGQNHHQTKATSSSSSSSSSTLAQILNQSSSLHVNGIMTEESIMNHEVNHETLIRELSEAPLNLTESTNSSSSSNANTNNSNSSSNSHLQQQLSQRNPVISSRTLSSTHSKKIPLTPKQKLLHRLQTGELMSSLSPPPQPIVTLSQQLQQQQQSLPVQTIQQQQQQQPPVVTIHQSLSLSSSDLQNSSGINHVVSMGNNNNTSSHSPQQQLDQYSYDQLLRAARDDFVVQDSLGKVVGVGEDPNSMLSVYDPADYSYYSYQNILGDENLFTGNNSASTSRQLLMMPSGSLGPDTMDQGPQGPLEFVLGFSGSSVDDHDGGDRNRDDDLQLNSIDPNDALSAIKSQQTESTLRNLLMMDTLRNNHTADDNAWLTLAAEYQNRVMNADTMSIGRGGGGNMRSNNANSSNLIVGSGGNIVSNSGSVVNMSNNSMSNNNSWINEWSPRTSSWQSHPTVSITSAGGIGGGGVGGGGVQDEVMDMSMIEHVKPIPMSNQMKRLQMQIQSSATNNEHAIDEMEITGLPILSQMSVNMPIDLQQTMSILPHGKDTLPMDLQQHHRMDIDDEPVNLMSVNMDQDQQDLIQQHHHHNVGGGHSSHLNHHQQLEQNNKGMQQQQQNNSYSLQIQSHHSPQEMQQNVSELSLSSNNNNNGNTSSSSNSDNIDERRIIRVKKNNKETLIMNNLNDDYQLAVEEQEHLNIIMDKPVQPKSIASLPLPFRLSRISGNELAVFNNTTKNIPPNCRLGPVEGPLRKATDDIANMNAAYPSLVMADGNNDLWQLDRLDDEFCNWMKFVRLAHSIKDQNALVVENDGYLYFMTCKEISPDTEVQVGYSYEYAQKYGLPYLLPMDAFLDQDNRIMKDNNLVISVKSPEPQPPSPQPQVQMLHDEGPEELEGCEDEVQQEAKTLTIETYQCFECDQEFSLVEDLQSHINTHKEVEAIRKPKKKAIKKFHNITPANDDTGRNVLTTTASSSSSTITNATASTSSIPLGKVQSQTINSVSSTVMESSSSGSGIVQRQQTATQRPALGDIGKQQDNSVTTGVGQPAAPAKVKCTMCYKSFATKERLEKHMIVHSDEDTKPLKCSFCTKRFLTNSALAGHTKTHAEEGKFFECPMCNIQPTMSNFSTPQLLQLKEHVQTHKSRDTGLFYCPKCPKGFIFYAMIRKHIRAFHGPRQYSCEDCPMSFPTSDKLKLHQLKHSDHREFLCAECGKQFKRKDKLREHTKRIHETKKKIIEINIPKDSKNSKKFIPKVAPEEYQRFPFKCQDCMLGFKRRGMLVNHLAKRHPEKKIKSVPELNQPILRLTRNYPCLYCERVYKSSSKRKSHILKAHPGKPIPPQLRGAASNSSTSLEAAASSSTSSNVVIVNNIEVVRPPTIGTIVQTVTEDGDPRSGIMNVSCTNNTENNLVSTTSTSHPGRKETNIVGKVAALPHACQWCYREYATRAKLLQHQRKAHINLMPAEMQTPRTQKNNVSKVAKKDKGPNSEAAASSSNKVSLKGEGIHQNVIHATKTMIMDQQSTLIIPDSTSAASTTTSSTIQTLASVTSEGFNEGNVIGYLLTTASVSPNDLGNLIPSELVMLGGPIPGLNGSGTTTATILTSQQSQSLAAVGGNPNQNITIIASSNSSKSNNV